MKRRIGCLVLSTLFAATHAADLPPDVKPLALEVYGVRGAYAIDANTLRVVIGASAGAGRDHAWGYRITSEDDPNYAYEKFVFPVGASIVEEGVEFPYPEEYAPPSDVATLPLNRTVVDLKLPTPLKTECHYGLVAQGDGGSIVTAAKSGAEFPGTPGVVNLPADALAAQIVGLRRVSNIGDGKILLEFGAGYSVRGGNDVSNFRVMVNGERRPVLGLGRRSKLDAYRCSGEWPFRAILLHDIFLDIGAPLRAGDKVVVELDPAVTAGNATAGFTFDPAVSISRSVQANQVGYLPDSPKMAYVGCWMASFPDSAAINVGMPENRGHSAEYTSLAPFALRLEEAPAFHIVDAKTGKTVWSGKAVLRASGLDPDKAQGGFRWRHSSSNVYGLDFSEFRTPGRYRVSVDGVGCSFDFSIADDVYVDAFKKQATGVFAQRCGFALEPKHADGWRRIACHKKGILASTLDRWTVGQMGPFKEHLKQDAAGNPIVLHTFGGHHDAGDFNPRSHIDVAQTLLGIYELFPQKFFDGQLNIPEAGNGIPDIVDEALWAVRLWVGLQDEDGGVYDGTESHGDPYLTQTVELDDQGDYAYAKDANGSFLAAGAFAQVSRILKSFGRDKEAADFLDRARRAYAWGADHKPPEEKMEAFYTAPRGYAAAELFHTTGESAYHDDFKTCVPWTGKADAPLRVDNQYDRIMAATSYTLIPRDKADPALWDSALTALRNEVGMYMWACAQRDYLYLTHPYVPVFWGFAAYEHFLMPAAHLWGVTHERQYFDWIVRTCDNTLGANALDLSWIVGIGTQTIRAPLHGSHYRPGGLVIVGMQAEGPVFSVNPNNFSYKETVYPEHRDDFATYHTFADAHFTIEMDEGVVKSQAQTMAVFGLLCPDAK